MKVLITGAGSPILRWVPELLKNRGFEVIEIFHKEYDLLFKDVVDDLFICHKPDYVIHGASYNGGIQKNLSLPATIFYRTSLIGLNVLDACQRYSVNKVVSLISSCAYPNKYSEDLREDLFFDGGPHVSVSCHGFAKRNVVYYGWSLMQQYDTTSFMNVVFNNCYGPRNSYDQDSMKVGDALIKKFVEAKKEGKNEVIVYGTGKPKRELLFTKDAARGVVEVLMNFDDKRLPIINIGSGTDISIADLAFKIASLIDYKGAIIFDTSKEDGQIRKLLNIERMKKELNFSPQTSLDQGIKESIQYYEQWQTK